MSDLTIAASPFARSLGRRFISLCALLLLASPVVFAAQDQALRFEDEFKAGQKAAMQNDYGEAAKRFTRANELKQNKCSDCYVWMARIEMATGKVDQALKSADQALTVAGDDLHRCNAELYRGVILGRQGNLLQAESAFKVASAANPQCIECRF